ncbi:hypothetical protein PAPHI01_0097 [Pancytospora philotis]|nr:hypothetical protein PAPHI01_0097 [Pancytospora philotis]
MAEDGRATQDTHEDSMPDDAEEVVSMADRLFFGDTERSLLFQDHAPALYRNAAHAGLPFAAVYKLVMWQLLHAESREALCDDWVMRFVGVENFISSYAEYFYFNRNVTVLLALLSKTPKPGGERGLDRDGAESSSLEKYITLLASIDGGECIIDDLVHECFLPAEARPVDRPAPNAMRLHSPISVDTDCELVLEWLYHVVSHKRLRRSMLRLIFDQVVYIETSSSFYKYGLLAKIIRQYSCMDKLIRNGQAREYVAQMRQLADDIGQGAHASADVSPEPGSADEMYAQALQAAGCQISSSAQQLSSELDIASGQIEGHRAAPSSLAYYLDDDAVEADNAYVLSNLAWEGLLFVLKDPHYAGPAVMSDVCGLLAVAVEETGDFFRKRFEENASSLAGALGESPALRTAINKHFKSAELLAALDSPADEKLGT